jgi:hypothetical protein
VRLRAGARERGARDEVKLKGEEEQGKEHFRLQRCLISNSKLNQNGMWVMASIETNVSKTEDSQRTVLLVVGVISIILIAGLAWFIWSAKRSGPTATVQPRLEAAFRQGSPEFDASRERIVIDKPEAEEAKRALGDIVMILHSNVHNFSGRTINGLEIYAAVVDHEGRPVKERTVIVIPERQPELEHNKALPVSVMLEGMKEAEDRANIKMEITGFKFK